MERDLNQLIDHEERLSSQIITLMSKGIDEQLNINDTIGLHFESRSSFYENEKRYSDFLKILWLINANEVDDNILLQQRSQVNQILNLEESHPMWYVLTDAEVISSKIKPFRLASHEYRLNRLENDGSNEDNDDFKGKGTDKCYKAKRLMNVFQDASKDRMIKLRNDTNPNGFVETSLERFIKDRFLREQDPNYATHPYMPLMLLLLMYKVKCPKKSFIGIIYLEQ